MRLGIVLCLLVLSPGARSDSSVPQRAHVCSGPQWHYPACGVMGPPCCLGPQLAFPSPGPPLYTPISIVVRELARLLDLDAEEAQRQLLILRKTKYRQQRRTLKEIERYPRLAALWRALPD